MDLAFMSVFKRYGEITKYFKLTAQTYFHRMMLVSGKAFLASLQEMGKSCLHCYYS